MGEEFVEALKAHLDVELNLDFVHTSDQICALVGEFAASWKSRQAGSEQPAMAIPLPVELRQWASIVQNPELMKSAAWQGLLAQRLHFFAYEIERLTADAAAPAESEERRAFFWLQR